MTLIQLRSPEMLARPRTSPLPLVSLLRMLASMASLPGNSASSASSTSVGRESRATLHADMEAFEAFFWSHERDILGYLWRLTGEEQAAHALSQETFLRVWQRFDTLQHYDQPRAWLFRVASNLGLNYLRGRTRRGTTARITDEMGNIIAFNGDPAQRLAENDAIRRTLLDLPPQQRAAVVLCDVYGLSSADAATALGLSHGGLKMSLWRGRERFRRDYQRKGVAE
jgi:RNA polymerase sigma-70 factor, ECF subfamily